MEHGQWPQESGNTAGQVPFQDRPQGGSYTGGQESIQSWPQGSGNTAGQVPFQDRPQGDSYTGGQESIQNWPLGNSSTGGQEPLREWQQETWIGPWPDAESPFDEPEDAPELRDLRSDELNNRSGDFWRTHTNGYAFGTSPGQTGQQARPVLSAEGETAKKTPRRIWPFAAMIGLCVVAIGLALYYVVFTVQEITVTGIEVLDEELTPEERAEEQRRREEEVVALSGIQMGEPIFSLNAAEIELRIEQDPNLIFRYMRKDLPSGIFLGVQEREACAWMSWNGIFYTMDRRGMVMYEAGVLPSWMIPEKKKTEDEDPDGTEAEGAAAEETVVIQLSGEESSDQPDAEAWAEAEEDGQPGTEDALQGQQTDDDPSDEEKLQKLVTEMAESLTRVDGLKIRSGTVAGQTLAFEEDAQRIVFDNLFIELKVLDCAGLIEVADLSNVDSLLLTTRDGFTVALGNSTELHAKLRSMLLTREELLRRDYHGGVINVNLPETPIFSPAVQ